MGKCDTNALGMVCLLVLFLGRFILAVASSGQDDHPRTASGEIQCGEGSLEPNEKPSIRLPSPAVEKREACPVAVFIRSHPKHPTSIRKASNHIILLLQTVSKHLYSHGHDSITDIHLHPPNYPHSGHLYGRLCLRHMPSRV